MSSTGDESCAEDAENIDVPDLDAVDVHTRLGVEFQTSRRFAGVSADPSRLIWFDAPIHDPVLFSGAGDLADRSRWLCFLLPRPRP